MKKLLPILCAAFGIFFSFFASAANGNCGPGFSAAPCVIVTSPGNQLYCSGANIPVTVLVSLPVGATFAWTNDNPLIGLPAAGVGNISAFTASNAGPIAILANITVTPTLAGCPGPPVTYVITVKPTPVLTTLPSNESLCPGQNASGAALTANLAGSTFVWTNSNTSIGLTASSTGNVPIFIATNTTLGNISGNISVWPTLNGCAGNPANYTITVKPKPSVVPPASQSLCPGNAVGATSLISAPLGASYTWTNSMPFIGLAVTGVGDVPAFIAVNTQSYALVGNIAITPTLNGCAGNAATYSLTVNPTPTLALSNISTCHGINNSVSNWISTPVGATYSWTNSNTSIGLAASGIGNHPAFVATNLGIAPIVGNIVIVPTLNGCVGPSSNYNLTVKPTPVYAAMANQIICTGANSPATVLVSVPPGASCAWTNTNTAIGLGSLGAGNVPFFVATNTTTNSIAGTISIVPTLSGCVGSAVNYSITVKPKPSVSVVPANQMVCIGDLVPASNFASVPAGATFSWTNTQSFIGLPVNGIGNIPVFAATNTANYILTGTIAVVPTLNGCAGNASSYTISVNNKVDLNLVLNQVVCDGGNAAAPAVTSVYAGVTYTWVNSNTAIGLAASGSVAVPAFVASNSSSSAISGTVTLTPSLNGCIGISSNYTVTVNARITASLPGNQLLCDGTPVAATAFSSTPAGATYAWTNSNTAIGLGASGSSNVPAFSTTNASTSSIAGTITVIPSLAGCTGVSGSYTITLKPSPLAVVPANITLCGGVNSSLVNFTSVPVGGSFNWLNTNTGIGLASSGAGSIPAFLATNITGSPISGTVSVAATLNGCTGSSNNFLFTIKPQPTLTPIANQVHCEGTNVASTAFSSSPAGATFSWMNNNTAVGLAASGTGNVPAFVASNSTSAFVTGNVDITPTLNGCVGVTSSYSISVTPKASIIQPLNQVVCAGDALSATNLISLPAGASFTWTNSNSGIGLGASGIGDVPAFIAVNSGTSSVSSTISITPTFNTCVGTNTSYTITVKPLPSANVPSNQTFCVGTNVAMEVLTSNPIGASYSWSNSNSAIGLAASGVGNVSSFIAGNLSNSAISGTVTVIPTLNGCIGNSNSYTLTVNPQPDVILPSNQVACDGANIPAANLSSASAATTFSWSNTAVSIGLAASGTGDVPAFTASNIGSTIVTATISVTPTIGLCSGAASTYTIVVNPIPTFSLPLNQAICAGASVPSTALTSIPAGASYSWTNSNASIGLAASGVGNVPSFTAVNAGTSVLSSTITITPALNGCIGLPNFYTLTINPLPSVAAILNQVACEGSTIASTVFSSVPSGATFSWTNSNSAVGLASNGIGNVPAFVALNGGSSAINASLVITPSLNGCIGTNGFYTLSVNPTPQALVPSNQNVCHGANVLATALTSLPVGATFAWTNDNIGIGLGASGITNSIPAFTASNMGNIVQIATVSVIPTLNGCIGNVSNYTITVNPVATVAASVNQSVCAGTVVPASNFVSIPAGALFTWANSNTSIGLAAAGSGNFVAFNATNSGFSSISGVITATPVLNGCAGTSSNFSITVKPNPILNSVANSNVCVGAILPLTTFSTNPGGANISWTNSNSAIGVASNGVGSVPSFTAGNSTSALLVGNFDVSATLNGCLSAISSFSITVNPLPVVQTLTNQVNCANTTVPSTTLLSIPSGAGFNWTNSNATIGLATNGIGNVPAFSAINSSSLAVQGTIAVTPVLNGCIGATANYTITINPAPTISAPANQIVCDGAALAATNFISIPVGASLAWTNSNAFIGLSASGVGNVPLFSAVNTSTAVISGTITVTPTLNTCVGSAVNYLLTVNPKPLIVIPTNQSVCNGAASTAITLASIPSGSSFTWQNSDATIGLPVNGNGNIPAFLAINSGSSTVTAGITVTPTLNGCVGFASGFSLVVEPTPATPTAVDATVCTNMAAVLNATAPGGNYEWFAASSGGIPLFSGASFLTPVLTASTSYFVQTTIAGCVSSREQVDATIVGFFIANAGTDDSICSGASYTLQATPNAAGYSCVWDEPSNPGFSNSFNTLITPSFTKMYIAKLTGPGGCVASDTVVVKVNPIPVVTTPSSISLCDGAQTGSINFITTPSNASCSWTNSNSSIGLPAAGSGNISSFMLTNPTFANSSANVLIHPIYRGCTGNTASFSIVVKPRPQLTSVLFDISVCSGENVPVNGLSVLPASASVDWIGNNSTIGLFSNGSGDVPSFKAINKTGTLQTNLINVTPSYQGCLGVTSSYKINVLESPDANFEFSPSAPTVQEPTIRFIELSLFAQSYDWSFGDGTSSSQQNPTHTYQDSGCYTVRLISENANGCRDTSYQEVCVGSSFSFYVPNAFSPNGDGINDYFYPTGFGLVENDFEMLVFNRLGVQVFSTNSPKDGWDGGASSVQFPIGAYLYKIRCKDTEGKAYDFVGTFTLMR